MEDEVVIRPKSVEHTVELPMLRGLREPWSGIHTWALKDMITYFP